MCVNDSTKILTTFEIKPGIGISTLLFGASMAEAESVFGKTEEIQLIDEIEEFQTTVWHYWTKGISLFFDDKNNQQFNSVEIDNRESKLWGQKIFSLKEKQIIELLTSKGILKYETEQQDWGEKRLSFDEANIDFYFEKNQLICINYGKLNLDSPILILNN